MAKMTHLAYTICLIGVGLSEPHTSDMNGRATISIKWNAYKCILFRRSYLNQYGLLHACMHSSHKE